MKRISALALAALFLFTCTVLVAEDTTDPPFKAPVCRGTISAVNASSLTVKHADGEATFVIVATTKVVGAKKTAAELAMNDPVTVTFKSEGGKDVATHIRVASK
jgi:hypothetical protein